MEQLPATVLGGQQLTKQKYLSFLEWVRGTNLFNAIREGTRTHLHNSITCAYGAEYIVRYNGNELKLNRGVIIQEPKDLPKELLLEFFINSPFYTPLEYIEDSENLLNNTEP